MKRPLLSSLESIELPYYCYNTCMIVCCISARLKPSSVSQVWEDIGQILAESLLHGVNCDDVADRLICLHNITQVEVRRFKPSRELTLLALEQDMPGSPVEHPGAARPVPPRTRSSRDLASRKLRSGTTIPDSGDALQTLVVAPATSGPRRDREDSACRLHMICGPLAHLCH